jgi:hypothetical protein
VRYDIIEISDRAAGKGSGERRRLSVFPIHKHQETNFRLISVKGVDDLGGGLHRMELDVLELFGFSVENGGNNHIGELLFFCTLIITPFI